MCGSSFFLLCFLLSLIVVHYARDCSCTCTCRLKVVPVVMHRSNVLHVSKNGSLVHLLSCTPSQEDQAKREEEFEDIKAALERKLSRRPTVKELRERRILMYGVGHAEYS